MTYLLGIDLGGTKIEVAIINADTKGIIDRHREPTEAHLGYDHIVSKIIKVYHLMQTKHHLSLKHIGIGTPGTIDPSNGLMKNCNTTALNGRPLKADLESALGLEVRISNDANCFAIAEAKMGAIPIYQPDANVVFGVIMGTGVGGGLVVNGQVINGRHGIAGEWGHNFLDDSGGQCYCGKSGCVEMVFAGPALENYYKSISGQELSMAEIVDLYRTENDTFSVATMERLFENAAKSLSVVINIIDPDAIVIGGGLGNIDELYTELGLRLPKYVFNPYCRTPFYKPILGDSAGVFGAAFL